MTAPTLDHPAKAHGQESVLHPAHLLREARRQEHLPNLAGPRVCPLDPDGDSATCRQRSWAGSRHPGCACYHTDMWVTEVSGTPIGVVGAPLAVLVAEQLFASEAGLLISITAAALYPLAANRS